MVQTIIFNEISGATTTSGDKTQLYPYLAASSSLGEKHGCQYWFCWCQFKPLCVFIAPASMSFCCWKCNGSPQLLATCIDCVWEIGLTFIWRLNKKSEIEVQHFYHERFSGAKVVNNNADNELADWDDWYGKAVFACSDIKWNRRCRVHPPGPWSSKYDRQHEWRGRIETASGFTVASITLIMDIACHDERQVTGSRFSLQKSKVNKWPGRSRRQMIRWRRPFFNQTPGKLTCDRRADWYTCVTKYCAVLCQIQSWNTMLTRRSKNCSW